jgi:hypothetical protein
LDIKFTKRLGRLWKVAELQLMSLCELSGFKYAIPQEEAAHDLLVDFGSGYKKIQVKSSYGRSDQGGFIFKLNRTRHNSTLNKKVLYNNTDVDYFFLYDCEGNSWLIPFSLLKGHGTVTPTLRFPGYQIKI